MAIVVALAFVALGLPQTLRVSVTATTLEGTNQVISLGPVASQEAIKQLGTNGGGFFNVNAAHPFENPTAGRTTQHFRHALDLRVARLHLRPDGRKPPTGMGADLGHGGLLIAGVAVTYWAEARATPS